jgi:hypothetical protein
MDYFAPFGESVCVDVAIEPVKMNSCESVPLGFRTLRGSPGLILLPAFLAISAVRGFCWSNSVFCSSSGLSSK